MTPTPIAEPAAAATPTEPRRLSAQRHSLTAQVNILPDAERAAVESFCRPIIADLAPGSALEMQYARAIAEGHYRLNRARAIEDNMFALHIAHRKDDTMGAEQIQISDALHQAHAFSEQPVAFDRLTTYEQRVRRGMALDLKLLKESQTARQAAHAKAFEVAQLLRQQALLDGTEFHVESEAKANNGFAFSFAEIDAGIARNRSLHKALTNRNNVERASVQAALNSLRKPARAA